MAGNGPTPKDPSKRARTNKDVAVVRILHAILADQPELPEFEVTTSYRDKDSGVIVTEREPYRWSPLTEQWWGMWASSPLARDFTSTDWSELRDTAFIHSEFWSGKTALAGELRLRTAKFGATPEDRLRLRIQFAEAVGAEVTTATKVAKARDRFRGMTVVASDEIESA